MITAIRETFPSAPKTKIGDNAHFQKGIPPPGIRNVSPYEAYINKKITTFAVINDFTLILSPEFSVFLFIIIPHFL